jgi:hypothetical protein
LQGNGVRHFSYGNISYAIREGTGDFTGNRPVLLVEKKSGTSLVNEYQVLQIETPYDFAGLIFSHALLRSGPDKNVFFFEDTIRRQLSIAQGGTKELAVQDPVKNKQIEMPCRTVKAMEKGAGFFTVYLSEQEKIPVLIEFANNDRLELHYRIRPWQETITLDFVEEARKEMSSKLEALGYRHVQLQPPVPGREAVDVCAEVERVVALNDASLKDAVRTIVNRSGKAALPGQYSLRAGTTEDGRDVVIFNDTSSDNATEQTVSLGDIKDQLFDAIIRGTCRDVDCRLVRCGFSADRQAKTGFFRKTPAVNSDEIRFTYTMTGKFSKDVLQKSALSNKNIAHDAFVSQKDRSLQTREIVVTRKHQMVK